VRWLQKLMDDERLKPERSTREVHPIPDAPDLPLDQRVHHLEVHLGQLWDAVWWISLPWYKRVAWRLLGFKAPIQQFYLPPDKVA
jgi:hypothetical protein